MTKNRATRAACSLVIALASATSPARAESLADAWAAALEQDHALAAARSQAEAAGMEAEAARGQRWPTLAVSGGYSRLDDSPSFDFSWTGLPLQPPPLFADDEITTGAATITVPLYTGGRIRSSIAAAGARAQGAEAQLVASTGDLKLAVAEAYFEVLRSRRALAVARSSVRTLESVERDTQAMFERELVPKNDLLTAQVALADARQSLLRASNAAEVALAAYNRRLAAPMDRAVELDDVVASPVQLPETLEELTAQALARRPELAALSAQAVAYGEMARAERARLLPQFVLMGSYQYLENQFLDDEAVGMAGIGVQWTPFDGGQSRKHAASLERTRRATEQQRSDAESLVALQIRQAWLALHEAQQRVQVTANAAEQADEGLRIAQERYSAGLGTQTQLLESETLRARAQRNRDDARLDEQVSRVRLARAAGML